LTLLAKLLHQRTAIAGWGFVVIILGLIVLAVIEIPIGFVQGNINALFNGIPSFSSSYDPSTNTFMDTMVVGGVLVFALFGAVIEIQRLTQKRTRGDEVI